MILIIVILLISIGSLGCVETEPTTAPTSSNPTPTPVQTLPQKTAPAPTPTITPTPTPPIPSHTSTPTPTPTPTTELTLPLAPDFELIEATSGDLISLSDYRGKVILLDFFATWCGACIKAIDYDLVPLYEQYGDQIIILSIDIREPYLTAEDLQTFAEEHDMGWPILMGSSSNVAGSYKIQVLPTIYIIDEDGVIRYFHLGSPGTEVLKNEIDSLL